MTATTDEKLASAADVKLALTGETKPQLSKEERLALINVNLAEVLNPEIIEKVLDEGRDPRIYWGTATTGRPHCGYFVPALKIGQLLAAGCHVVILLADIHGFLDNLKAPIELVNYRAQYYKFCIKSILEAVGVPTDKLEFVLGSSYQKSPEYIMDVYKMCSMVSEHDAKKAGAEVVKQSDNAPLSGLLYPILQVLDEEYLKVDCQFGGVDQRKLFAAAKEWLPRLGYKERAHIMNPMVPGLQGSKMSSSDPDSKIDLLDAPEVVAKKIKKAEAAPGVTEGNGLLAFTEFVLLPAAALYGDGEFHVDRERDGLPPLVYKDVAQMHADYQNDVLTPQLLKPAITKALTALLAPIQAAYQASKEWQEITLKAYPPEEKKKKEKKVKNKGSRYPGAAKGAEGAADGAAAEEGKAAAPAQ
ncbi:tyrosyl-tRNA synthetase [Cercophora newfieldiana]|uniref:Tyrosine--tRNA ligase n=1 Tax=Cercophora newfieldiana TaxID=92897 RepID=A0AA39YHV7_9PEZI|nr:tyrosyl-tRNA synthetase [Cercophora newfieldiana]